MKIKIIDVLQNTEPLVGLDKYGQVLIIISMLFWAAYLVLEVDMLRAVLVLISLICGIYSFAYHQREVIK